MTLFSDHFNMPAKVGKKLPGVPEKTILASFSGIDSSKWELSLHKFDFDAEMNEALQQLCQASGDRNVFFDPAFLAAAQERLGHAKKRLLVLSEMLGESMSVKMAMPVQQEKVGFPGQNVWRIWSHPFAPLSTPLIIANERIEIVSKFCQMVPLLDTARLGAILFQDLPTESYFMQALLRQPEFAERIVIHGESQRAALKPGTIESYDKSAFSAKHARELRRQYRKMSELGEIELEVATEFWQVMIRFEEFLLLETKSWKGRRGTSIHIIKKTAAFARQALANLITQKNCRVYTLRLDGKAVSSMIVLKSGNRYFPWKMAFDENYNNYSVGKQLAVLVSKDLLLEEKFEGADSLATSDNNLMNHIWFDRLALCNLTIGLGKSLSQASTNAQIISEAVDRKVKYVNMAKSLFNKFR